MTDLPNSFAERVVQTAAQLHAWCVENNRVVTPDLAVYEDTAALLLDRAPGTLANWRCRSGDVPAWYRPSKGARVRYKLHDLATWLERQRCEGEK